MKKTTPPVGRPKKEPTVIVTVPVDKLSLVSKILKREIVTTQTPVVRVRVPAAQADTIRDRIKKGK